MYSLRNALLSTIVYEAEHLVIQGKFRHEHTFFVLMIVY